MISRDMNLADWKGRLAGWQSTLLKAETEENEAACLAYIDIAKEHIKQIESRVLIGAS